MERYIHKSHRFLALCRFFNVISEAIGDGILEKINRKTKYFKINRKTKEIMKAISPNQS